MNKKSLFFIVTTFAFALFLPEVGFCTVENSLQNVQDKVAYLLPLLATLGLGFSGISFLIGSPNARSHLTLAIIGAVIGFGASSLMDLIRRLVN